MMSIFVKQIFLKIAGVINGGFIFAKKKSSGKK